MMLRKTIFIAYVCCLVFSACKESQRRPSGADMVYSEDSAMAHFLLEPDRALVLIDSAVILGHITPQRADYLRAVVMYNGKDDVDSCIGMCQRLIDGKSWEALPDSDDAVSFRVDLYRLMATASTFTGNHMAVIRNANEGVKLAHGVPKLLGDECDLLSRMGYVMCQVGQTDDGIDAMLRAEELSTKDGTWSSFLAYLNNSKKLYYVYSRLHRYEEAKMAVNKALVRLDELKGNVRQVKCVPEGILNDEEALQEFVDYYKASYFSFLANIHYQQNDLESAEFWLGELAKNSNSANPVKTQESIEPLIALGRYAEAERRIAALREEAGSDTICEDYVKLLRLEMKLAQKTGRQTDRVGLAERIVTVSDSVNSRSVDIMFADAATQYKLQDEQMRRKDAEDRLLVTLITVGAVLFVVAAVLACVYIRRLLAKQRSVSAELSRVRQELAEVIENDEEQPVSAEIPLEDIYRRAEERMKEKMPFRDPKYDMLSLARDISTNRNYLSAAINSVAGMNFRSWLAKYRIEYAKTLLLSGREITNDELAEACGFDNRVTLYRQFKNIEGMTPNEWLERETSVTEPQEGDDNR